MTSRVMVLGVGAFAHAVQTVLQECGAETACYLTRPYGHFGPKIVGQTWNSEDHPSPLPLIEKFKPDLIIPQAVAWAEQPWATDLVKQGWPIFSPVGEAMQIEISRQEASELCCQYDIPVPVFHHVQNRIEARQLTESDPRPYVLKNPICSPFSPIHAIICESEEDTKGWIERVDYAEGLFLQEYLGTEEAGHFVFISGGEISSLVTNQEYKRAFTGDMGPLAGAPLAGIVEQDPEDKYGLARELIHPLKPWFEKTGYCGPLQVTAIRKDGTWHAIEYNIRLGVSATSLLLRMLNNPVEVLLSVVQNQTPVLDWHPEKHFGCTLTLAGYGYPYVIPSVPKLPVEVSAPLSCDLWWNEVDEEDGQLYMANHKNFEMGHRIADVNACAAELGLAVEQIAKEIRKIRCLGSYYRLDLKELADKYLSLLTSEKAA
ncbi:MAG: phosphoribosylamine--glycine ligase [SAR324 cluster bacterium]|nr:phosphoribosylamine--glycine ligase [SAR324 cluster bacterium]MBL7034468.1 phosphoribosylamine--glycine ligase [SAR324 cluster bacterium]